VTNVKLNIALFGAVAALSVSLFGVSSLYLVARNNRDSLCSLKADIQLRFVTGKQFLKDHPNGIPGITAETLRQSVRNQKATLDSLSGLDCQSDLLGISGRDPLGSFFGK
jgi:hypothetical protein